MKYLWILVMVLVCAGCGAKSESEHGRAVADAFEMYGVEATFVGQVEIDPERFEDASEFVEPSPDHSLIIDIPELNLDVSMTSLTGMDVTHTMQVERYWALPGDTSWAKIHFDGWEPPPPRHTMEERIPLRGPEGRPNVILMKFNDGEYESAYIAMEDVRKVVRQVLAEEDLPPLRIVAGTPIRVTDSPPELPETLIEIGEVIKVNGEVYDCDCLVCDFLRERWVADERNK